MKVILVAGIHAVGKSTACKLASDKFGIPHFTASQIIHKERSSAISKDSKLVDNVVDNQLLLIQGLSKLSKTGSLLLDGHFTIWRKGDGGIETIHVDVFRKLEIGSVVLFTDHPENISKRMHDRDGILHPVEVLRSHQETEISHAKHVAEVLGLPMEMLNAFDIDGMTRVLSDWGICNHHDR